MPERFFEDFKVGQVWTYPAWAEEEGSLLNSHTV